MVRISYKKDRQMKKEILVAISEGFYMVRISFMKNCSDYNLRLHRSPFFSQIQRGRKCFMKQCVNT